MIISIRLKSGDDIVDCLIPCLLAVFFDKHFVFLAAVGKAAGTVNTTAHTSHTLDKVGVKNALALFKQSKLTLINTVVPLSANKLIFTNEAGMVGEIEVKR